MKNMEKLIFVGTDQLFAASKNRAIKNKNRNNKLWCDSNFKCSYRRGKK